MARGALQIESEHGIHRVIFDGHDLTRVLTDLRLDLGVNSLPVAEVSLRIIDVRMLGDAEMRIAFGAGVREALIALGWTPPAGEQ